MIVLFVFIISVVLTVTLIQSFKDIMLASPVSTGNSTEFLNTYSGNVYNAFDNGLILIIVLFLAISTIFAMKTYMPSRFIPVSILIGILFCFVGGLLQYILDQWINNIAFLSILGYLPIINFISGYFLELCILYTFIMIILLHTRLGDGG